MDRYVIFVPIEERKRYRAMGWRLTPWGGLLGTPHGEWSVIMEWEGDGEPPMPRRETWGEINRKTGGAASGDFS